MVPERGAEASLASPEYPAGRPWKDVVAVY